MSLFLLSLVLSQQDSQPDGAVLVSKMIARYHAAKIISGDFTSSITIGEDKATITTKLQLERPNKLFLRQAVNPGNRTFIVTSDGKEFSYSKPFDAPNTDEHHSARLLEDVRPDTGLGDIVRAAAQSIAERSAVLDLLVSDIQDLQFLKGQWQSVENTGKVDLNGEQVYRVVGKWRLNNKTESTANYGMFITEDGDLKKYVIDGNFQVDNADPKAPFLTVHVSREFSVNVSIDGDVDSKLFTVVKS